MDLDVPNMISEQPSLWLLCGPDKHVRWSSWANTIEWRTHRVPRETYLLLIQVGRKGKKDKHKLQEIPEKKIMTTPQNESKNV